MDALDLCFGLLTKDLAATGFEGWVSFTSTAKTKSFLLCIPGAQDREFNDNHGSHEPLSYNIKCTLIQIHRRSIPLHHYGRPFRSPHALHLSTPTPQRLSQLLPKSRPLCPQVQRHGRGSAFLHFGAARTSM